MSRAFLVIIALFLFGFANAAPPAAGLKTDPEWKPFNALVAKAKGAMMGDPDEALAIAQQAEKFAQERPQSAYSSEALATSLWLEAEALTRINQVERARAHIDRALALARHSGKPTKLRGDINLSLARIADVTGDVELALKSFHKAHDIFAALGEARSQSMALQGLGAIYDEAHDFEKEIEYYRRAAQVYSGDPALDLSSANNLGYALKQLGRYDEALKDFERALKISRELKSPFLQARILTNIASVRVKRRELDLADRAASDALTLLGKKDESGWAPFVWGVKAEIAYERGNLEAAARDLGKTFQGMDLKNTIAPFRDIHEIAYRIYKARGDAARALTHHEAFKRLGDEGRSLSASANLALIGAQFDFTAQQLEIEQLKTEQLKRDINLANSRAATQLIVFVSISIIGGLLFFWIGLGYFSMRRHRNEINKANIELKKTVSERDAEIVRRKQTENDLRSAKEAAEQANHAKTQFLANMSHELRTPLNAVIGFAEIMSKELLGPIGSRSYKTYASDIHSSGRHLLAILNDILDMARIDAGKTDLNEEEFCLSDAVEGAMRMFQAEMAAGKIIRFADEAPGLCLTADERMVRQILVNLLSNAAKFTKETGTIEVRVARAADGGADISVADDGIGIPADKLDLVLEPFGQVADTFARDRGGVGLGLPIVNALARLHGGNLSLSSKLGEGTTALVHLPRERITSERTSALAS